MSKKQQGHQTVACAAHVQKMPALQDGSIFAFGSVSHLSRFGTSLYTNGWTKLVSAASTRWQSMRICPLFPLIVDDCPGSVARELAELCVWFSSTYENTPLGLVGVWRAGMEAVVDEQSSGAVLLDSPDTYKLSLPSGLNSLVLDTATTFCSRNSRPVTLLGTPKDKQGELLWSLLETLNRDFHVCFHLEKYLLRVLTELEVEISTGKQKVVLVSASNLGQSRNLFCDAGLKILNLTVPGWVASPENIAKICEEISKFSNDSSLMFVMDLFVN
jgi:hypothetical protein